MHNQIAELSKENSELLQENIELRKLLEDSLDYLAHDELASDLMWKIEKALENV